MITVKASTTEVLPATAGEVVLSVLDGGEAAVLAASASAIIKDSDGNTLSTQTPTPSENTITATIAADLFSDVEQDCLITWEFTVDGATHQVNTIFDVVKCILYNPISDQDLKDRHPDLSEDLPSTQSNFETQIEEAFRIVKEDIRNRGNRPNLLVDASQIASLVELKALELIFEGFTRKVDDLHYERWKWYGDRYQSRFTQMRFRYDQNEDAVIDSRLQFGSIKLQR